MEQFLIKLGAVWATMDHNARTHARKAHESTTDTLRIFHDAKGIAYQECAAEVRKIIADARKLG